MKTYPFYKLVLFVILALLSFAVVRLLFLIANHSPLGENAIRHAANQALLWTLIFVLLIEARVRIKGGSQKDKLLYWHLMFAIPFFLCLLSMKFLMHQIGITQTTLLGYLFSLTFAGTLATGIPMILRF